jgi:2-methylisocitrate lyase-like PEP mutase family enzyme
VAAPRGGLDVTNRFRRLHEPGSFLVLPNAWDAASARLVEECGAEAIATTSAGLAWCHGYPDGQALPPGVLVAAVKEIRRATELPLSVDFEQGYSDAPERVAETVSALVDAGAVGINLEDGRGEPRLLAAKIEAVKRAAERAGADLFVNARSDVYLRGLTAPERAVEETLSRAALYREAGCDGLFVPGLVDEAATRSLVAAIDLPLNLLVRPGLPPAATLRQWGVRRLSAGTAVCQAALAALRRAARELLETGRGDALAAGAPSVAELNALFARSAAR